MDFPILAPHLLTHWLLQRGKISIDRAASESFWMHFQKQKAPWMEGFDSTDFVPLAIYGDEAEYTITKEKILVLYISFPMFEGSKTVFGSRFPVFCIRSERLFGYDTIGPVFDFLSWSVNTMYSGTFPAKNLAGDDLRGLGPNMMPNDPMYNGYKFRLVELRGDWKHHLHTFKLASHWSCNDVCHCCKASKTNMLYPYTDFVRQPRWLCTMRTHAQFLAEQLNEPINSLCYTARFHYHLIRFCSVHTVQLGIAQFCHGGCLYELFQVQWFRGDDKASKLRHAFICFKDFIRKHKIQCSQPPFKSYMYVTSGEEYCFFGSKASWHDFKQLHSSDQFPI
ncbi:ppk25 [Symbiodinium sp. CCMP2456]|nr:ppk25 [Symbiodinium sp. CCMP2456]